MAACSRLPSSGLTPFHSPTASHGTDSAIRPGVLDQRRLGLQRADPVAVVRSAPTRVAPRRHRATSTSSRPTGSDPATHPDHHDLPRVPAHDRREKRTPAAARPQDRQRLPAHPRSSSASMPGPMPLRPGAPGRFLFHRAAIAFLEGHNGLWFERAPRIPTSDAAVEHRRLRPWWVREGATALEGRHVGPNSSRDRRAHIVLAQPLKFRIPLASVHDNELFAVHVTLEAAGDRRSRLASPRRWPPSTTPQHLEPAAAEDAEA